jgi:2-keto-4-pentenoate hydratase/2-oxohepta-3-ene-1,7-dioic acid hydratase in catechol pathway
VIERVFRVASSAETFYAVERAGAFRRAVLRDGDLFTGYDPGEPLTQGLVGLKVLAPVTPSKIVCIGQNYRDHAAEMGKPVPEEPVIFIKPATAVLDPGEPIRIPPGVGRVDYEAELALVIGRRAHRVSRLAAWDYIFGLTCLNDVTARDLQRKDGQYTRSKGFDTFAPLGPGIAVGADHEARQVEGWLNAERRQGSTTAQLIFDIEHLVEFITFVMTLEPGDIISTGTPAGVGPMKPGDVVTVKVEGIGELTNPVVAE